MGEKILVADDSEINRKILRLRLETAGYNVDEAIDGEEAVVMASINKYKAIFMDICMPRIDGIEATKLIRKTGNEVEIVGSGCNDTDIEKSKQAGMNDFVMKPLNFSKILNILEKK